MANELLVYIFLSDVGFFAPILLARSLDRYSTFQARSKYVPICSAI